MEGNWLYEVPHNYGLTESISEWLSILVNAVLVVVDNLQNPAGATSAAGP